MRGVQGKFLIQGRGTPEAYKAFVPRDLPPVPPIALDREAERIHSRAMLALGRLDGLSHVLPDADLLLTFYVRREAVLSSQIEGTQSSMADLLRFEADPNAAHGDDLLEVSNYVTAMRHGLGRLRDGFPLSLRLLREMHGTLLQSGRGSGMDAGEFRRSQNWIGGSRPGNAQFVPPPVPEMQEALHRLEKFLHGEAADYPPLVQAAMLHVQFESIHPFLDGNGRLGRLLIALLLVERGVLVEPLLYMSLYLKQNRDEYYELLQKVRYEGAWEEWVLFFLQGVASTAEKANQLAKNLLALFERDEESLRNIG